VVDFVMAMVLLLAFLVSLFPPIQYCFITFSRSGIYRCSIAAKSIPLSAAIISLYINYPSDNVHPSQLPQRQPQQAPASTSALKVPEVYVFNCPFY
jgi:hypothetical protein